MPSIICTLSDFHVIRPRYESTQEDLISWVSAIHAQAEAGQNHSVSSEQLANLRRDIKADLMRVGCKPSMIHKRGHEISDLLHEDWHRMEVYRLDQLAHGKGLHARQQVYNAAADRVFEAFYSKPKIIPEHLFHVSCTGYASPSSAQKLIAGRDWNAIVTHVYHMGCYAALPAIRLAAALVHHEKVRSDIVHTELCTLHLDPLQHEPDQLVIQSLFADGFIKYSVSSAEQNLTGLDILAMHEQMIPQSSHAMYWGISEWGFRFSLSKEIPMLIAQYVPRYLEVLCQKAGLDYVKMTQEAIFAIHPGGVKILDGLKRILNLREDQMTISREILRQYGNMSSATLPHIWEKINSDPNIPQGRHIVSLAFGPGLTIAGTILQKR